MLHCFANACLEVSCCVKRERFVIVVKCFIVDDIWCEAGFGVVQPECCGDSTDEERVSLQRIIFVKVANVHLEQYVFVLF